MAYTDSKIQCIGTGVTDAATIGFARNVAVACLVHHPCILYAVGAIIRVALTSEASSLVVTRRVTPYNDVTGVTNVATITIPTLTVAGTIIYIKGLAARTAANLLPVMLNAGDELKFVMANTGGNQYWVPWYEAYPRPETYANNSDFVLSA